MKPAFILAMSVGHPSPSRRATSSPPPRAKTRKRVRVSDLARKYRTDAANGDEALLVSDHDPAPNARPTIEQPNRGSTKKASSRIVRKSRAKSTKARSQVASPLNAPNHYKPPIRFSRFPSTWPEAVSQVSQAVSTAVSEGHDRIRIDVKTPELIADAHRMGHSYSDEESRHRRRIALLVGSTNQILTEIFSPDSPTSPLQNPYEILISPTRAAVYFNSAEDARIGKKYMNVDMAHLVDARVLGDPKEEGANNPNVCVVIAPSNKQGNPSHIENVELVHYSSWNTPKLVIMLNPDLVALTRFTSLDNEPRQPCFLTDYLPSYYIDPAAFPSKAATGAVLRCYPRKWEMYLLKVHNDMGFRLIAEQGDPPSAEKIRFEFAWRIERETESKATM